MIPVPKGFSFSTASAGFKYKERDDLALVVCDTPCAAAGTFTRNKFQAAPVLVGKGMLENTPRARAVLINAGQANACTGQAGIEDCAATLVMTAEAAGLAPEEILPASTGVIGPRMNLEVWKAAMGPLKDGLGTATPEQFARAIMTTDSFPKLAWATLQADGSVPSPTTPDDATPGVTVLGVTKGAGMICPDMATMLAVVLTDAEVEPELWADMLGKAVAASFNAITVDGDTSTNDTVYALAGSGSGIRFDETNAGALFEALLQVCQDLAYMIVQDAEGGTKVLRIGVEGAADDAQAELAARAVGHSPLVKTALYGRDANWGRIVAALGRSGAGFDPDEVSVSIAGVEIFRGGAPLSGDFDEQLKPHLEKDDVDIIVSLGQGPGTYVLLASDLTHEYVTINADYRT